jgi:hypothetical protein
MTVRKVEIERLSVISSKPFEEILASLEAAIGHPDMVEFMKATHASRTFAEFESVVHQHLGTTGLMMFMKFDQGAVLRKETGLDTPKIVRYVIGNPLNVTGIILILDYFLVLHASPVTGMALWSIAICLFLIGHKIEGNLRAMTLIIIFKYLKSRKAILASR